MSVSVFEPYVAHVFCKGFEGKAVESADYQGIHDCRAAHALGGTKLCTYGCLGFGTCVASVSVRCFKNGIRMECLLLISPFARAAVCVRRLVQRCHFFGSSQQQVFVDCNSKDKGVVVRKACTVGCIACSRCVKACEFGAISVKDFLASIDYNKCTSCGNCIEECPVGCINAYDSIPVCKKTDECAV